MNIYAAAASRPNSPSNSSTSAAESARSSTPVESQANARRGHMSLEWTLGQQSGVGSTFLVHASWLQPHGGIVAGMWTLSSARSATSHNTHDIWSDSTCFSSQSLVQWSLIHVIALSLTFYCCFAQLQLAPLCRSAERASHSMHGFKACPSISLHWQEDVHRTDGAEEH